MVELRRVREYYSPLYFWYNDEWNKVTNILFFNENGVIIDVGRGYFDDGKEKTFNGNICKKLKVNFKMKDNFIIRSKKELFEDEKTYDLYIYAGNVKMKHLGKRQMTFGEIFDYWLVDGTEINKFDKSLRENLYKYDIDMEKTLDKIKENYKYGSMYMKKEDLEKEIKNIRTLNNKIIKEVDRIKNYEIPYTENGRVFF